MKVRIVIWRRMLPSKLSWSRLMKRKLEANRLIDYDRSQAMKRKLEASEGQARESADALQARRLGYDSDASHVSWECE